MPIINQIVKGGGTTPTGTKQITTNGTHDVAAYATADVQVPTTAPAYYIEKRVSAGKLMNTGNSIIDFTGVNDIGSYVLVYQYSGAGFPANTNLDLSSLTSMSGSYGCQWAFSDTTGIVSVDLSNLSSITGINGCERMLSNIRSLVSVDLGALQTIIMNYSVASMFWGCTSLTNVNLSSLTSITGYSACSYMFRDCSSLQSVVFDSLKDVTPASIMNSAFQSCTNLATLSFPALTSTSFGSNTNQFSNLVASVTGCTIHFPSNLDPIGGSTTISNLSTYPYFGGTSTLLAFDLPATNHLIGVDTVEYERSPKFDTGTALAWRVNGTAVTATTYYTSTTNNPAVGDTIYSDSACTTAVTTVASIS